jgi:signal transduction histidine kinase
MDENKRNNHEYVSWLEQELVKLEKECSALRSRLDYGEAETTETRLLNLLSDYSLSCNNIPEIIQTVLAELGQALQVERCLLIEFDLEKPFEKAINGSLLQLATTPHVRYVYNAPSCPSKDYKQAACLCLPELVSASAAHQPLIINDTKTTSRKYLCSQNPTEYLHQDIRAWLGVPIFFGGQLLALLELSFSNYPHTWTTSEIKLVQLIAQRLGGPVSHLRLSAQMEMAYRQTVTMISGIAEGAVVADRTGRIVLVNQSLLRMFGGNEADWQGVRLREKLPFMMEEVPEQTMLYHGNVADRTFQVITSPLASETWGEIGLASISILQDLTEEVRMVRAKDNFLTLISHELRTPLTSISGSLDILSDPDVGDLSPVQQEFLRVAIKNTYRLIALLETTFDITKLETGHLRLDQGPVLLEEVMHRVLDNPWLESYQHKRLNFRVDFSKAPRVYADPGRLIQIFENLVSNACKYTPVDGWVEIKSTPTDDGQVCISISDTGVGLSMQEQVHVFEKFYRVDHSLTREVGGSGLGLTITRSLVELHGSQLYLESVPGKGSCFSFTLPTPY